MSQQQQNQEEEYILTPEDIEELEQLKKEIEASTRAMMEQRDREVVTDD